MPGIVDLESQGQDSHGNLNSGKANGKANAKEVWIGLAIFAFCLVIDLIYNTLVAEPGRLHIFDSCHYIQAGLYLTIAVEHALGAASAPPANLGQMLLLDGFGMPFCAAIAALISANKMTSFALIFVQSTVISLTAAATYACALKMKLGCAWSAAAALLWSLYPAAIVSAGTFLSEPLTGLLATSLALAALLCQSHQRPRNWCAFGLVAGAIVVTKPALLVYLALVLAIMVASLISKLKQLGQARKQITLNAIALGLGAFLSILPWVVVTAAFAGHAEIMPSRLPSTNMALGCDYEIGFWETMPVPPLTLQNYARNPIRVFYELATEHTIEMPAILGKKFARLYFAPFNDFHDSVFGIDYDAQRLAHSLILALALMAILTIPTSKKASNEEKFGLAVVAASLATHCCYMAFESLPRYAFSAMPLLIIAAICTVREIVIARNSKAIAIAMAALLLAVAAANVQFDDVQTEKYMLKQGETAERQTKAIDSNYKPAWIALVTDADLNSQNCKIKFNGHEIAARQTSLGRYPSGFRYQDTIDDIQNLLSRIRKVKAEQLAHYSIISLPLELLETNKANTIEVTALEPLTIFGQKLQTDKEFRVIPALRYFSVTKMFASESGLDGRVPDHRLVIASQATNKVNRKALSANQELRLFLLVSTQPSLNIDAQAGHADSSLRLW
ncbi:hypothetical protein BH11CYA1_BH11CYA1_21730 [soil metagenome]